MIIFLFWLSKVREYGNHQQLMSNKDGVYYTLVNAQTLVEQKIEIHRTKSLELLGIDDVEGDDDDNHLTNDGL